MQQFLQKLKITLKTNRKLLYLVGVIIGLSVVGLVFFSLSTKEKISISNGPIIQEKMDAPKLEAKTITNKSALGFTPANNFATSDFKQYALKENFSDQEVNDFASNFSFTKRSKIENDVILFENNDKATRGVLAFNQKSGTFIYESYGIYKPFSHLTDPTQITTAFLTKIGLYDQTISCNITYKKISLPDVTYVECHRDWNNLGAPLVNLGGMLNIPENVRLATLSVGKTYEFTPADKAIIDTSTQENGKARPNDFNTITTAVGKDGRIISIASTMRQLDVVKTQSLAFYPIKVISPQQALEVMKKNKSTFSVSIPAGNGSVDFKKVYPDGKAITENATVTDMMLVYLDKPLANGQTMYEPYYIIRGGATLDSGYYVRFVNAIQADSSKNSPIGSLSLWKYTAHMFSIPQSYAQTANKPTVIFTQPATDGTTIQGEVTFKTKVSVTNSTWKSFSVVFDGYPLSTQDALDGMQNSSSGTFEFDLNSAQLPNGNHTFTVVAEAKNGQKGEGSRTVIIANPTPSPTFTPTPTITVPISSSPTPSFTPVPTASITPRSEISLTPIDQVTPLSPSQTPTPINPACVEPPPPPQCVGGPTFYQKSITVEGYGTLTVAQTTGHVFFFVSTTAVDTSLNAARLALYKAVEEQYVISSAKILQGNPARIAQIKTLEDANGLTIEAEGNIRVRGINNPYIENANRRVLEMVQNNRIDEYASKPNIFTDGIIQQLSAVLVGGDGDVQGGTACYLSGISPIIYLYSQENQHVTIGLPSTRTYSDPITQDNTWKVTVSPERISADGIDRPYLYYEYDPRITFALPNTGFVFSQKTLLEDIENSIAKPLHLTQKETASLTQEIKNALFEKHSSSYYRVFLIDDSTVNTTLPLKISPQPDHIYRIQLVLKPVRKDAIFPHPVLHPIERSGFTVVELGAQVQE